MPATIAIANGNVNSSRFDSTRYRAHVEVKEIRRQRLLLLLKEHGGKQAVLAGVIKKAPAQISQWIGHNRTIEEETARQIERAAHKGKGWMDLPIDAPGTGSGAIQLSIAEDAPYSRRWLFPRLDEATVAGLRPDQLRDLETAMLAVAATLGVNIAKRKAA